MEKQIGPKLESQWKAFYVTHNLPPLNSMAPPGRLKFVCANTYAGEHDDPRNYDMLLMVPGIIDIQEGDQIEVVITRNGVRVN